MTYHVSPSPSQTQLREAVAMAMQYQNDDVLMEPGDYTFDTPLQIGDTAFGKIVLGGRLRNPNAVRWLFPTVKDRPLLTLNALRSTYLHDFTVVGANTRYATESGWYFEPSDNPSDYLASGITDRNFGIAIDDNAKAGSGGITFERVFVEQVATGWGVTPSGTTLNSSGHRWVDCGAGKCDILWSCGQSQARTNYIERFTAGPSRLAFTGLDHGKKQGVPPIIDGFEGSFIHTLGRFNSRHGQVLSWNNMWSERIKGIVHWMGRDGAGACIRNSTFKINMVNDINPMLSENTGIPCVAEAHSMLTFDNCVIGRNPKDKVTLTEGKSGMFQFINMPDFTKDFVLG